MLTCHLFKRALCFVYITSRIQDDMSTSFLDFLLKLNKCNMFIAIEL
jgi:hypothetical protein